MKRRAWKAKDVRTLKKLAKAESEWPLPHAHAHARAREIIEEFPPSSGTR